jgi:hypothetical protein
VKAVQLRWEQVLAWRMARQYLEEPARDGPLEVLRRLCGVQAQVAAAAEMAVAVRLPAAETAGLRSALRERSVIKTWAMRGTLHLLPADVAGDYLALLADVRSWEKPAWQRAFISRSQLETLQEVIPEVLDRRVLSREELTAEVLRRTRDADLADHLRSGWGAVLKPLAWQGLLCQGPAAGNRVTFTTPGTWAPDWQGIPRVEDAARVVIPSYLGAYGPASMEAFDGWLTRGASSKRSLHAWFAAAADRLARVDIEGTEAFARIEDVDQVAAAQPSGAVRLLPAFDQYVLGPGTGDSRMVPSDRRSEVSRAAGWIAPVVVAAGRVAGTWDTHHRTLDVNLFEEAGHLPEGELERESDRIGALLGEKFRLSVTSRASTGARATTTRRAEGISG